jgi:hypothetical protein
VVWNMAFMFPNSWDDDPIWRTHIFQGGRSTTNHIYKTKNMTLGLSENDVKTHSIQWIMMISHYKIAIKWVFLDTSIWSWYGLWCLHQQGNHGKDFSQSQLLAFQFEFCFLQCGAPAVMFAGLCSPPEVQTILTQTIEFTKLCVCQLS